MEADEETRGPVPRRVHAFADYLVAAVLLAGPWLFGFADETTIGKWISVVAGAGLLVMDAATAYEGGIVRRVIPMRAHLVADGLVGLFVAASPWLFKFGDGGVNAWLPFAIIGLGGVACAALTEKAPSASTSEDSTPRIA
jgi:hypothetical protein